VSVGSGTRSGTSHKGSNQFRRDTIRYDSKGVVEVESIVTATTTANGVLANIAGHINFIHLVRRSASSSLIDLSSSQDELAECKRRHLPRSRLPSDLRAQCQRTRSPPIQARQCHFRSNVLRRHQAPAHRMFRGTVPSLSRLNSCRSRLHLRRKLLENSDVNSTTRHEEPHQHLH
jgi:hypothetical protein